MSKKIDEATAHIDKQNLDGCIECLLQLRDLSRVQDLECLGEQAKEEIRAEIIEGAGHLAYFAEHLEVLIRYSNGTLDKKGPARDPKKPGFPWPI